MDSGKELHTLEIRGEVMKQQEEMNPGLAELREGVEEKKTTI